MAKHGVRQNTVSLWSKTKKHRDTYLNSFYLTVEKTLLSFGANEKKMRFWKQYFLQHVDSLKDMYGIYSCKFTEDNLQIIHRHLKQQKLLLEQKYTDNFNILPNLDNQIRKLQAKVYGNSNTNLQQHSQQQVHANMQANMLENMLENIQSENEENGPDKLVELNGEKQEQEKVLIENVKTNQVEVPEEQNEEQSELQIQRNQQIQE